jgi:large subunit ribosomal protein L23
MSVLKRPIITEKTTILGKAGKYVFEIGMTANKVEVAKAVEKMYGVTVTDVNTMRQIGRKKSRNTKKRASTGFTSTFKKAIITLKDGDMIDFYAEM